MREFLARMISRAGGRGLALFLGLLAASLYCVWLLSADARQQLNKLATAPADNLQWTLSQLEVEFGAMQAAALVASLEDPASLDELRKRFNVVYSRTAIITTASAFEPVLADEGVHTAMSRVVRFLDETIPVIDGPDVQLAAALPDFIRASEAIRPDIRMTTLVGIKVYSEITEANRERAAEAMFDLAMLVLFLLLLLLGLVVVLAHVLAITRRQTDEIEQTRSRLGSIVGTSLDAVVVVDRQGKVIEFNPAAERIFGYEKSDVMGQPMADLIIPPRYRELHNEGMKRHLETGATRMIDRGLFQMEAMHKDGSTFPVELSISTAKSAEGEIYISFVRDISDRVSAERELVDARDRAVLGEKAKAELLAIMSHEMRTPLNGILGTLDLLDSTELDARQRHFVEVMGTSGQMLLRHVNDVLDVSRMDADKTEPTSVGFSLSELVHSVAESLRGPASARGNTVKVTMLGDVPPFVSGDRGRIEQVLVNLVGNAIKFTENGTVTIETEPMPDSDEVEIRVIDTGVGIAETDLVRIFDDFVTLDASFARSSEGTGLGLGITRRLVDILKGEIGVESELGEGSVFWVRMPLPAVRGQVSEQGAPRATKQPDARGRKVLLVEDNEINRLVAREMLRAIGCIVEEATDGIEGVEHAEQKRFDLVLMDISMPRLDGVSAARQIRDGSGPNRRTPIVALTAHTLPEDIQQFRDAGFSDVLIKPLSRGQVADVLAGSFEDRGPSPSGDGADDEIVEVLGDDTATLVRTKAIAEIFASLEETEQRLRADAEFAEILEEVHKMTGLSAVVGLSDTHSRLISLNEALKNPDGRDLCELVSSIRKSLEAVRDAA